MKLDKIKKLIAKGRVAAIIKDVAGRRMLFGFERANKRSRKAHVKYFSKPIDMATLSDDPKVRADATSLEQAIANQKALAMSQRPSSNPVPETPATPNLPANPDPQSNL